MTHIPTRSPDECRRLADRQAAGEDLGFSDEFVKTWRTPPEARASKVAGVPAPAGPSIAAPAKADPPERAATAQPAVERADAPAT